MNHYWTSHPLSIAHLAFPCTVGEPRKILPPMQLRAHTMIQHQCPHPQSFNHNCAPEAEFTQRNQPIYYPQTYNRSRLGSSDGRLQTISARRWIGIPTTLLCFPDRCSLMSSFRTYAKVLLRWVYHRTSFSSVNQLSILRRNTCSIMRVVSCHVQRYSECQ